MTARLRPTLRFLAALVATNLKASVALRGAFLLQAALMFGNNLIFFVVWWILFDRVEEIAGWRLADMSLLYGLVAAAYGLTVVFGGGVRQLARLVAEGELDPLLTQPKNALLHVGASRSFASGWGDLVSGVLLLALSGRVEGLAGILGATVAVLLGASVLTSAGIVFGSLAFWLGPMENLARQLWEFVVTFSLYPPTIFTPPVKVLLFTALPAGFVAHLPVEIVRAPGLGALALATGGAALLAGIAVAVFGAGLRRYESGSRFTAVS
ncbi:MAG: ABC transporter permease [Planctomycetales bacterium]|nr:ABC transporter permease [Planctomycetales bacterium]